MRNVTWPPTDAYSLETARVRILGEPCCFRVKKHRRARIAGIRTLRRSGLEYRAGSHSSRAVLSARWCACFSGLGSMELGMTLPGAAGNQSQIHKERILEGTDRSNLSLDAPTPAGQSAGGIRPLPCPQAKAYSTNYKTSCPMGSRLSHLSRYTEWKAVIWAEFIRPQSVSLNQFTRFR